MNALWENSSVRAVTWIYRAFYPLITTYYHAKDKYFAETQLCLWNTSYQSNSIVEIGLQKSYLININWTMEHKFATSVSINNDLPLSVTFLDPKNALYHTTKSDSQWNWNPTYIYISYSTVTKKWPVHAQLPIGREVLKVTVNCPTFSWPGNANHHRASASLQIFLAYLKSSWTTLSLSANVLHGLLFSLPGRGRKWLLWVQTLQLSKVGSTNQTWGRRARS